MPSGYRVEVKFETFDTEDNSDLLMIYNGPSSSSVLLATLSGLKSTPEAYLSNGSSLWFHFSTDGRLTRQGFNATYKAGTV